MDSVQTFVEKHRAKVSEYSLELFKETVQAFGIMSMIFIVTDNKKSLTTAKMKEILGVSVILGFIQLLLHIVDEESHQLVRNGMRASIGAAIVKSAIRR